MSINRLITIFLCFLFISPLNAQWEWQNAEFGTLDLGYELDGFIILDNEEKGDGVVQMLVQPDGKTLLLGYSGDTSTTNNHHVLIRLDIDGQLDVSFGENGKVKLPSINHESRSDRYERYGDFGAIALQSDNKIIAVGKREGSTHHNIILLRYTSEGILDTTFKKEEVAIEDIEIWAKKIRLCIQEDDKILIAGSSNNNLLLTRFNHNGLIDSTFGDFGKVITNIGKRDAPAKILLQKDQKIIVIGRTNNYSGEKSEFALARFLPNGELDTSFGQEGKVKTTIGRGEEARPADGVIQKDGKIIVLGSAKGDYQTDHAMARYHPDGQLDKTFGNKGKTITSVSPYRDEGTAIALQPDGKIMVAGNSQEWASHLTLIRYHENGRLDYTFGDKGKQRPYLSVHGSVVASMMLQDNKVILAGNLRLESRPNSDFLVIRFLSDFNVGTINFQSQANNALVYPNPIKTTVNLEYSLENPEILTIQLINLNGSILKTYLQNQYQKAGDYQKTIELPINLPKGVYFLKITSPNGQFAVKIVK